MKQHSQPILPPKRDVFSCEAEDYSDELKRWRYRSVLKTVCSLLDSLRCHISKLKSFIPTAALGKRDSHTFIEVQNEVSLYRRSYEDASALLMRGCCVITASLCRTACWDSTIVCVKGLQLRFLHGQRPRAARLWNCCSGLFIVMYTLLFTINIQLSCPPTEYLIYVLSFKKKMQCGKSWRRVFVKRVLC